MSTLEAQSSISSSRRVARNAWLIHIVLILTSALFLFPLLWLVSTSLKPLNETMRQPPTWIPSHIQWQNYKNAILYGSDKLGYIPFLAYVRNTLLVSVLSVSGTLVSNALVAYAFARPRWPGRD